MKFKGSDKFRKSLLNYRINTEGVTGLPEQEQRSGTMW
jgi:hypothetical protein